MLTKHNFEAAKICTKEVDRGYGLNLLQVSQERTAATDGICLIIVNGTADEGPELEPVLITREDALAIAKGPKKDGVVHYAVNEDTSLSFFPTYGCVDDQVKASLIGDRFPNVDLVIPRDEPSVTFKLDGEVLGKLIPVLTRLAKTKTAAGELTFSFHGDDKAIKIEAENPDTGQGAVAVIMPIKQ